MQCARCDTHNDEAARFCKNCGTRLVTACPACRQPVGDGARFCHACGAAIGAGAVSSPPAASAGALSSERRQVTVLFADIKDSMELLANRDPEEARGLLDPVLQRMMDAVHHYEGTVNQLLGDGIMALFGAPVAHEDHAVRGCYAGLRIQEALAQEAEEVRRRFGVPLRVRVGLNSGEVVVRTIAGDLHTDYTAVGQTTHLAARMEQMATPGSILVSAHTARLVEGFVDLVPLGQFRVKGLAEPQEVFEVAGAGRPRTRLEVAMARGLTPFVGRRHELAVLQHALQAARAGRGQAILVRGDAGVGKSRLVWEFTHGPGTSGCRVLEAPPVAHGRPTPWAPVIGLLQALLGLGEEDDTPTVRDRVCRALAALDLPFGSALPPLLALLDVRVEDQAWRELDPPERRERTLQSLLRLLVAESQAGEPLVLVVEDLHAADSETRALVETLANGLGAARVLLLATGRPEDRPAWADAGHASVLPLHPLARDGAAELLTTLLGAQGDLGPLQQRLFERTEGNPFFLEESVRTLAETGALVGVKGAYRLARPVDAIQIPPTVVAVLASRIDRLDPADKALLQAAAVIGRDVPLPLLASLVEQPAEALADRLATLTRAEMLLEGALFPEIHYAFAHALTHEVVYAGLLRERRRILHARVMDLLERLAPTVPDDEVDRLAHHASRGEVWDKALAYLRRAAARAMGRSAWREAAASFEEALAALGHLPESHEHRALAVDLRFGLRTALLAVGEHERSFAVLGEAEALARGLPDPRRTARALVFMTTYHWSTGEPEQAVETGRRALAVAEELDDGELRVVASTGLGWAHHALGDLGGAMAFLERVRSLTEGPLRWERFGLAGLPAVASRTWLAWCLVERGDFPEAATRADEGMAIAEAAGHPYSLVVACFGAALPYLWRLEPARAVPVLERGLALCREFGIRTWLTAHASALGHALVLAGRPAEGLPLLQEAIDVAEAIRTRFRHSMRLAWLAEGLHRLGRTADARTTALAALDLARRCRERAHEAHVLRLLGTIETAADPWGAGTRYEEGLALATQLGLQPLVARCHAGLGRLARTRGDARAADEHRATAAALYRAAGLALNPDDPA